MPLHNHPKKGASMNRIAQILLFSMLFQAPVYAMEIGAERGLDEFVPSNKEKEQSSCLNKKQRFAQWCIRNQCKLGTTSALIGLGGFIWTTVAMIKTPDCLYNLDSCTVSCHSEYSSEINYLEQSNNTFPYDCPEFCPSISTKNITLTNNGTINEYCTIIAPNAYGTLNCTYVEENDPQDCSRKNKKYSAKTIGGGVTSMTALIMGLIGAKLRFKKN